MSSEKDSRGYTAEGELKGAAKTAHEDKVARERDEGANEKVSYIVTHLNLIICSLFRIRSLRHVALKAAAVRQSNMDADLIARVI